MAEPFSWTALLSAGSAAAGIGSSLLGAGGSRAAGDAGMQAGIYNAILAQQRAQLARDQASQETTRIVMQGRQKEATLAASYGENGIDANFGSSAVALDALRDTTTLDAMTRVYAGEVTARGDEADARLALTRGAQEQRAGYLGAGTRLLGGAADSLKLLGGLKLGNFGFGSGSASVSV